MRKYAKKRVVVEGKRIRFIIRRLKLFSFINYQHSRFCLFFTKFNFPKLNLQYKFGSTDFIILLYKQLYVAVFNF